MAAISHLLFSYPKVPGSLHMFGEQFAKIERRHPDAVN